MDQVYYPIEARLVNEWLDAIRLECPSIEPTLFGRSQDELDFHFGGCSTDDYPEMKLRLEVAKDRFVEIKTNSNHAHLLPWTIYDSYERTSFNPQISIRLAELMPVGFLFRERLIDSSVDFNSDKLFREQIARMDNDGVPETPGVSFESQKNLIHGKLQRFADADKNGEPETRGSASRQYTANQLRWLSEQELNELTQNGFDLSTSNETGQTALMLSAFPPFNSNQFRKLVRAGADVNARRSDGLTGLMLACAGSEEIAVKEWLHAGASVDIRGPNNSTALMLGATNGVIVSDLLAHGAKATDLDDDGNTALDYAMEDISVMWAGKRLKSVELLSAALRTVASHSLTRSHERALEVARKLRLEIEIDREFGGRTMSEAIREARSEPRTTERLQYLNDILEFVDLEITEIELADKIVEILVAAVSRQPET